MDMCLAELIPDYADFIPVLARANSQLGRPREFFGKHLISFIFFATEWQFWRKIRRNSRLNGNNRELTNLAGGEYGRVCVGTGGTAVRRSAAAARWRPLCRRHGLAANGLWPGIALAACACPDPFCRYDSSKGCTRGARGADRRGLGGQRLGRSTHGRGEQAARRLS